MGGGVGENLVNFNETGLSKNNNSNKIVWTIFKSVMQIEHLRTNPGHS